MQMKYNCEKAAMRSNICRKKYKLKLSSGKKTVAYASN